jgi:hypothetical protein
MADQSSAFISYSHKDKEKASSLASYLGRLGLKVWLDTKELHAGQSIIDAVSTAIQQSDLYVVCLLPAAVKSQWVVHELNTALTLETTKGRPRVMPVLLAHTDLPVTLVGRLYIDMTESLDQAKPKVQHSVESLLKVRLPSEAEPTTAHRQVIISSIRLQLAEETDKHYGFDHNFDKEDVAEEAHEKVQALRRRASGILLNFVSASQMDFSSKYFQFPNGGITDRIEDVSGPFTGSIAKKAIVEVEAPNPKDAKLNELVSSKLSRLGVSRVTYIFAISPPIIRLAQQMLTKLQEKYVILGWDSERGADIELPDDLQVSIRCSDEQIGLTLETKYQFQMDSRTKNFSVREFIDLIPSESK